MRQRRRRQQNLGSANAGSDNDVAALDYCRVNQDPSACRQPKRGDPAEFHAGDLRGHLSLCQRQTLRAQLRLDRAVDVQSARAECDDSGVELALVAAALQDQGVGTVFEAQPVPSAERRGVGVFVEAGEHDDFVMRQCRSNGSRQVRRALFDRDGFESKLSGELLNRVDGRPPVLVAPGPASLMRRSSRAAERDDLSFRCRRLR